jgi:regulator of PEP synthase PpsR (kinase-PPPase family)
MGASVIPRVYAVSDGTGSTAHLVTRAALKQFSPDVEVVRVPRVRTTEDVLRVLERASHERALVVHTLVSRELRIVMLREGRARDTPTIDLMGPLIARLSEFLGTEPRAEPGLFRREDAENTQRIEALDFAVKHDDGQNLSDLPDAEIVLVGVSRTAKTPVSIYLAYRGWRVGNVPVVLGVEPPPVLFDLPKRRVVGLVATPERLLELRRSRVPFLGTTSTGYADLASIRKELAYALEVFRRRRDWPIVDVTNKSIEEVASEILVLTARR